MGNDPIQEAFMQNDRSRWQMLVLAGALAAATTLGCGGGGGGGGGGTARITGNVADATTSARETAHTTWLARLGEELLGLARRAYAAVDDTIGGIAVKVKKGSSESDGLTDDQGDFDVPGAPSGDVTVSFGRGNCEASLPIPDVVDGSTIELQDVSVDCDNAQPDKFVETFQGVILNKPGSPNGNLNVCAFGGGGNHIRAVKTTDADFVGTSFDDLAEGDIIESTGTRAGNGANSTLFATSVQKVGTSSTGNCGTIPTPTVEPTTTATPEGTTTPTETATPEPTQTPIP
jgi:hypothetical protein